MTKRNKLMDKMTEALDLLEGIESTLIIILESYEYRDKMNEDDIKVKHSLSLVVIDTKKMLRKLRTIINNLSK